MPELTEEQFSAVVAAIKADENEARAAKRPAITMAAYETLRSYACAGLVDALRHGAGKVVEGANLRRVLEAM
jgi:hypothetical protein